MPGPGVATTHHAHALDPTFIGAPIRVHPGRPLLVSLCQATFWLGVVGWWVALILGFFTLG